MSDFVTLLQSQFASKDGARRGVQAVVVCGAYLPMQLNALEKLPKVPLLKVPAGTALGISYWVQSQQGSVPYVLVALQQAGDSSGAAAAAAAGNSQLAALVSACAGQQVVPMAPRSWQAALEAEQQLFTQLRLYEGTCWSLSLSGLHSKRALRHSLAVRSLMGPEGIKAVLAMAEKQHLFAAVRMERLRGSGSSRQDDDVRLQLLVECKDVADAIAVGRQVVLIVSRTKLSADELAAVPADLFTDAAPLS